jgi:alpha-glucosidase
MIYTETDGKNFVMLIDERPILFHSPSRPFLSVCEDSSLMNRFLGSIPLRSTRRRYTALEDVSYDPELGILRFSRGARSVSFTVKESEDGTLQLSPMKLSHPFGRLRFLFNTNQDEPIFGCGGNTVSPNLRGIHINIRGGCGTTGGDMLHPIEILGKYSGSNDINAPAFAIPAFFTGNLNFYSFWFGGASFFDFSHRNYITADFAGVPEKIILGKAETVKEVHSHQAELYGKRCSLPVWYQSGIIAGVCGGSEALLEALDTFKKAEIPISSLYIRDWTGSHRTGSGESEFWDWVWNREYYPHLDEVIRELSDHNINTLCYINPHLAMEGRLYAEASKNGYLIKDTDGSNLLSDMGGFMAGHIDLTNQKACQWIRQILIDNVFSLGFSGVITDMMQYLPDNSVLNGNTTPVKVFNY